MFPKLKRTFAKVDRDTWPRKFSSMYRSRSAHLPDAVAEEVAAIFDNVYATNSDQLAFTYEQALPFLPPLVDGDRLHTYRELCAKLSINRSRRG